MKRKAAAVFFCIAAATAQGQPETESAYSEVFYQSANLRIQAYLYKPDGDGPFPVVIYNHGSRDGRERASVPFQYVGKMLTRAGYAVLVPERRGYGKSDGSTWREEVGSDQYRLITRLQAETDDVLAAVEYLRTVRFADTSRMGVMGWSFGGIVTMLAASRSTAFLAAVDQAGGLLVPIVDLDAGRDLRVRAVDELESVEAVEALLHPHRLHGSAPYSTTLRRP